MESKKLEFTWKYEVVEECGHYKAIIKDPLDIHNRPINVTPFASYTLAEEFCKQYIEAQKIAVDLTIKQIVENSVPADVNFNIPLKPITKNRVVEESPALTFSGDVKDLPQWFAVNYLEIQKTMLRDGELTIQWRKYG